MGSRHKKIIALGVYFWAHWGAGYKLKFPGDECSDSSHRKGTCVLLKECPIIQEELNMGKIPTSCGFSSGLPVICCPGLESSTTTTPAVTTSMVNEPGSRAKHWCEEYSKHCPKNHTYAGVISGLPQIFAHMAAVGYGPRNDIHWKCGGSLISDKFVLTAAHCIEDSKYGTVNWVLLGTHIHPPEEGVYRDRRGQIHEVARRIVHPGYSPPAKYDDIGLIEIGPSITNNYTSLVSEELRPACLRPNDDIGYVYSIVSRWSGVGFGVTPKLALLRVVVEIFDETKCNEIFDNDITANGPLPRGFDFKIMCAGMLKDGKDICQGDSGGPLQFPIHGQCQHEITGITSFGKDCSFPKSPSVYMRVSSYIEWIEDNVWPQQI